MGYLEDTVLELIANGTLPPPDGGFSVMGFSSILLLSVTVLSFVVPVLLIYPPVPVTESDFLAQTHRKLGVEASKSGLRTQYSRSKSSVPRIHSLWVHPVKSCAGIELSHSRVFPSGLQYDRLFMFAQLRSPFPVAVDAAEAEKSDHSWEMATMRQFPRMANVQVDIWVPDEAKLQGKLSQDDRPTDSYVILRFPCQDKGWRGALQMTAAKLKNGASAQPERQIMLPLEYPSTEEIKAKGYELEKVKIWKDTVLALNMECEVPKELQRYLGVSNKLSIFRLHPNRLRQVRRNAPSKTVAGYQPIAGFQDAYPVNILSLSSLQALSEKMEKDENMERLDLRRFRSNIIFEGSPAYDEEAWKAIDISPENSENVRKASFDVCCRCVRCTVPNVDPDKGTRHKAEPHKALTRYREVDAGAPKKGCMAMQMVPIFQDVRDVQDMESWLEVGMVIHVLERGEHFYKK